MAEDLNGITPTATVTNRRGFITQAASVGRANCPVYYTRCYPIVNGGRVFTRFAARRFVLLPQRAPLQGDSPPERELHRGLF